MNFSLIEVNTKLLKFMRESHETNEIIKQEITQLTERLELLEDRIEEKEREAQSVEDALEQAQEALDAAGNGPSFDSGS